MKIIFIVIDTLCAGHLGCYGYDYNTSPNIDRMAEESLLFERAYSTDVPTQPSYTAMFTGQRGVKTGIVSHSPTENLSYKPGFRQNEIPYLSTILANNGYKTAAVSTLYLMRSWFAKGFQYYLNPAAGKPRRFLQQIDAEDINAMAIPWIKENIKQDFFLFIHYWDPHTIYLPPKPYRDLFYNGNPTDPENHSLDDWRRCILYPMHKGLVDEIRRAYNLSEDITDVDFVRSQYDGEIRYVDDSVEEVFQTLKDLGVTDETLFIITSDHGENFGEHGEYFEHGTVYEPIIKTPLIMRHPGLFQRKRVSEYVQNIDIPYTILDLADIPKPKEFEGRNLVSVANGDVEGYSEVYSNQGLWSAKRTIITEDGWKLIKTIDSGFWECPPRELYNLNKDPGENRNLVWEEEDVAKELEFKMAVWLEKELGHKPDPLRLIASSGLPGKKDLLEVLEEYVKRGSTYEEIRMRMGF